MNAPDPAIRVIKVTQLDLVIPRPDAGAVPESAAAGIAAALERGDLSEASALAARELEGIAAQATSNPDHAARMHGIVAAACFDRSDFATAEAHWARAAALFELGARSVERAVALGELALCRYVQRDPDGASDYVLEASDILSRARDQSVEAGRELVVILRRMAERLESLGQAEDAVPYAELACDESAALTGPSVREGFYSWCELFDLRAALGHVGGLDEPVEHASAYFDQMEDATVDDRLELLIRAANLLRLQGRSDEASLVCRQGLALVPEQPNTPLVRALHELAGDIELRDGRPGAALAFYRPLLALIADGETPIPIEEYLAILRGASEAFVASGEQTAGAELLEQFLRVAAAPEVPPIYILEGRERMYNLCLESNRLIRAASEAQFFAQLAEEQCGAGSLEHVVGLQRLGSILRTLGNEECREVLLRALDLSLGRETIPVDVVVNIRLELADLSAHRGEVREALEEQDEVLALAREATGPFSALVCRSQLARADSFATLGLFGEMGEALEYVRQSMEREPLSEVLRAEYHRQMAVLLEEEGAPDDLLGHLGEARQLLESVGAERSLKYAEILAVTGASIAEQSEFSGVCWEDVRDYLERARNVWVELGLDTSVGFGEFALCCRGLAKQFLEAEELLPGQADEVADFYQAMTAEASKVHLLTGFMEGRTDEEEGEGSGDPD